MIKEVADVTIFELNDDGSFGAPVLYLDSLKVSTLEQTADQAEARGGKGNLPLVIWDFGKEVTLNLEDALFSPKSMAIMMGNGTLKTATKVQRTITFKGTTKPAYWTAPDGTQYKVPVDAKVYDETGTIASSSLTEGKTYTMVWDQTVTGNTIEIGPDSFPGTYGLIGDTYARSAVTGKDEFFQFKVSKAKMSPERTLTFQAEGDPSTFNMSLRVMRPEAGNMIELTQYSVPDEQKYTPGG